MYSIYKCKSHINNNNKRKKRKEERKKKKRKTIPLPKRPLAEEYLHTTCLTLILLMWRIW